MFIVHDPFLIKSKENSFVPGRVGERSITTTREAHGTGKKRSEQGNVRGPISGMHEKRIHLYG
jgi:hypothetical protein